MPPESSSRAPSRAPVRPSRTLPSWTRVVPVASAVVLAATWSHHDAVVLRLLVAVALVGSVLAAVHHAEVVAHRVGEPFGSLVLAVAVTVIEVGLIVTLMLGGGEAAGSYARDTVFAAVMITLNGIVGIALLVGAARHHTVSFNAEGSGSALSTVVVLASLTMVLPGFTVSAAGLAYTGTQLGFVAVVSLLLYAAFVVTQTGRHRDFFLPVPAEPDRPVPAEAHADPPTGRESLVSAGLLVLSLVSVVGLAKLLSPTIESVVAGLGFPYTVVGVVIALLVLAPESIAAVRNARRDRVQISLNLALGSAMASIGLTIPAVAVASWWIEGPLTLGLEPLQIVLLAITVALSTLTLAQGRATVLQGVVHLSVLAAYLFFSVSP